MAKINTTRYEFFPKWCETNGFPEPTPEYKFHTTRRWRIDFAFVNYKVAIEINGGAYINGRHNRGASYVKDLEKLNELTANGWRVLQFIPSQIYTHECKDLIFKTLALNGFNTS